MNACIQETESVNLEAPRVEQIINNPNSLGPDDLVKIQRAKPTGENTFLYSHIVIGVIIESQKSVTDYYDGLVQAQIKENKLLAPTRHQVIVNGKYKCFNSFEQIDVIMEISGDSFTTTCTETEQWKQLRLSTILRYYRAKLPLISGVLGGETVVHDFLNFIPSNVTLSRDELNYIAENHPISHDYLQSLVRILQVSLDSSGIVLFLTDHWQRFPGIFVALTNLVPTNNSLFDAVHFYAESYWQSHPDDIDIAIMLVNFLIDSGRTLECHVFVPLLKSAVWDYPAAGIALSRLSIAEEKEYDAFSYLNLASLSVGWPEATNEERLPKQERRVLKASLTGVHAAYFRAIQELHRKIGEERFVSMVERFVNEKPQVIEELHTTKRSEYCCDEHKVDSREELFLYDPGIAEDVDIAGDIANAPFSDQFLDVIKAVTATNAKYKKLTQKRMNLASDATGNLITAIHMKDGALVKQVFAAMRKSHIATAADYALIYRAGFLGILDLNELDLTTAHGSFSAVQKSSLEFIQHIVRQTK